MHAKGYLIFVKAKIPSTVGTVASLHLHPAKGGQPFQPVEEMELNEGKGILGNPRYFARIRGNGEVSKRQVSIIEREQIAEHAETLGLKRIPPGIVRSNIETSGIDLIELLGWEVEVGEALVHFYEARTPCAKMDQIAPGLRKLMCNDQQGVLGQVVRSGKVMVGDKVKGVRFLAPTRPNLP